MSDNAQLLPAVSSFLSQPKQLLIDGEWVDAKDGQTFDTVNPATEQVLVKVAQASAVDVDRAVVAARNAFEAGSPWFGFSPRDRSHLLWRIGDLIDEQAEEFAQLESLDNGKSLDSARGDVGVAAELFRYFAGWATKMEGTTIPIEGADLPQGGDASAAGLLARHDAVAPRWLATVRDLDSRGAWDDRLVDALCDPPESFVMASVFAHVVTYAAARRQLARHLLRGLGVAVDDGDPITWLRRQRGEE